MARGLVIALLIWGAAGCQAFWTEHGGVGQRCYSDEPRCHAGLTCINSTCQQVNGDADVEEMGESDSDTNEPDNTESDIATEEESGCQPSCPESSAPDCVDGLCHDPAAGNCGYFRPGKDDGAELCKVPGGEYTVGCDNGIADCPPESQPEFTVTLTAGFYLDRFEVTNRRFKAYLVLPEKPFNPLT